MEDHRHRVVEKFSLCFIVTSDSVYRGVKEDAIRPLYDSVEEICSKVVKKLYTVIPNDVKLLEDTVKKYIEVCDVVLVTGGTGVSRRDISVDVVRSLAKTDIPGIGELFRFLSYRDIGVYAYLSRAGGFIVGNSLVVVSPGNVNAVKLMLKDIICQLAPHIVYEIKY